MHTSPGSLLSTARRALSSLRFATFALAIAGGGCEGPQPRTPADTAATTAKATPDSVAPPSPGRTLGTAPKRLRETYVPFWSVSFQHDDAFTVRLTPPFTACDAPQMPPLARDSLWPDLNYHGVVVAATRQSFDSVAALFGFHRRAGRWVTVDEHGTTMEAAGVRGPIWRGLRGGRLGAVVPDRPHPTIPDARTPGIGPQDSFLAMVSHPSGCTIVLGFHPNVDGGADSAVVRRVLESVRVGRDAPSPDFLPPRTDSARVSDGESGAQSDDVAERDRRREYGIGLLYLVPDSVDRTDTIAVHGQPSVQSPILVRYTGSPYGPLTLLGADSLAAAAIEYGYEADALPIVERGTDTSWVRIVYAADTTGASSRTGWVKKVPGLVSDTTWMELFLKTGALFFRDARDQVYYEWPQGRALDRSVLQDGYVHETISALGPWLLAKVVTPPDFCELPAERARYSYVWIRALDDHGRPRVFYYSRGC